MNRNAMLSFSVEMSPSLYDLIEQMSEDANSSKGDTFKKALVLLNIIIQEEKKGNHIGILDKDKKIIEEIVGITKC